MAASVAWMEFGWLVGVACEGHPVAAAVEEVWPLVEMELIAEVDAVVEDELDGGGDCCCGEVALMASATALRAADCIISSSSAATPGGEATVSSSAGEASGECLPSGERERSRVGCGEWSLGDRLEYSAVDRLLLLWSWPLSTARKGRRGLFFFARIMHMYGILERA